MTRTYLSLSLCQYNIHIKVIASLGVSTRVWILRLTPSFCAQSIPELGDQFWWFSWTKKHLSSTHPFQKCSCCVPGFIFVDNQSPWLFWHTQFHFLVTRDLVWHFPLVRVTKGPTMKLCDFGQSGPPGDAWSAWKSRPKITVMGISMEINGKMWEHLLKSPRNGCFQWF